MGSRRCHGARRSSRAHERPASPNPTRRVSPPPPMTGPSSAACPGRGRRPGAGSVTSDVKSQFAAAAYSSDEFRIHCYKWVLVWGGAGAAGPVCAWRAGVSHTSGRRCKQRVARGRAGLPQVSAPLTPHSPTLPARILQCPRRSTHPWSLCPFGHTNERLRRRPLYREDRPGPLYRADLCPAVRAHQECPMGNECGFAHHVRAVWRGAAGLCPMMAGGKGVGAAFVASDPGGIPRRARVEASPLISTHPQLPSGTAIPPVPRPIHTSNAHFPCQTPNAPSTGFRAL